MARLQREIPSLEEGRLFTVNRARVNDSMGTALPSDLGYVPKILRHPIRGFHDLLDKNHSLLL
jgi:hypothetical protein